MNGHTSGRPSEASTSSANAQRGRFDEVAVDRAQAQRRDQRVRLSAEDVVEVLL